MRLFLSCSLGLLLAACQTSAPTQRPAATTSQTTQTTTPPASLRNTRWVLRQLAGRPVPAPASAEPYLLLRGNELQAEGNGGCNRFFGPFTQPATNQLRFGNLASTRMACLSPAASTTETEFLRALTDTRAYHISGDTLHLFGEAAGQPVAVLHAVYLR